MEYFHSFHRNVLHVDTPYISTKYCNRTVARHFIHLRQMPSSVSITIKQGQLPCQFTKLPCMPGLSSVATWPDGLPISLAGELHFTYLGQLELFCRLIIAIRLRDSRPIKTPEGSNSVSIKEALLMFFRKPTALLLTFAFAGMVFVNVGFMTLDANLSS